MKEKTKHSEEQGLLLDRKDMGKAGVG